MGNSAIQNPRKIYSQFVDAGAISILSNNVYKITYYEIITGASGTLTLPSGATINAGEFAGANCVLSEIDGNNKPTYITPLDGGGAPVTSTLNVGTGAWVKSAATVSVNVALIYSINIAAINYQNLDNFYIIDSVLNSGLTVGTTTITGGANTKVLYNNNGVVGEYTVTGTGSAVLNTSPTFVTDITTPLINPSTFLNIGNAAIPGGSLSKVRIGLGTGFTDIGEWASGRGGIWFNLATPTVSNFHVGANATGTDGYLNGSTASRLLVGGSIKLSVFNTQMTFNPSAATGSTTNFDFTTPNNTSRTASTNVSNFIVRGGTITYNAGALTDWYANYFTANTLTFGSTSTATNSYGLYVEAAKAGTNATITNNYAAGFSGNVNIIGDPYINGVAPTGTGSAVLNTSPTFVTGLTTPLIYGGSASGGNITLMSTSHATKGTMFFGASGGDQKHVFYVGTSSGQIQIRSLVGTLSQTAIYLGVAAGSETSSNYAFNWSGTLNLNAQGVTNGIDFQQGSQSRMTLYGATTSGATPRWLINFPQQTGITASTETNDFLINSKTQTYAAGAQTLLRGLYYKTQSIAFASGSNAVTTYYTAYFESGTAGAGCSGITNNYSLGTAGKAKFGGNIELTQTVTTEALVSDTSVTIVINGTTYKLLAKA